MNCKLGRAIRNSFNVVNRDISKNIRASLGFVKICKKFLILKIDFRVALHLVVVNLEGLLDHFKIPSMPLDRKFAHREGTYNL